MNAVRALHREAMELAQLAYVSELEGDTELAVSRNHQAFEKEAEAVRLVANDTSLEPTRSVLHRSAAALAVSIGELREAERLIGAGLAGDPPEEIAQELRELFALVNLKRYLATIPWKSADEAVEEIKKRRVVLRGRLRHASGIRENEIRIVDSNEKSHRIVVPEELLDDIVRPLWNETVEIVGYRYHGRTELRDIKKIEEEPEESPL